MSRKSRVLPPRRKRLKREARLKAAGPWLASYTGKHVIKSYARWFGVDLTCALKELQSLGVPLDPRYAAALMRTLELRRRRRPATPASTTQMDAPYADLDWHSEVDGGWHGAAESEEAEPW